jgi:uncharacterized hydrophobic protein (TIGR00341 family)
MRLINVVVYHSQREEFIDFLNLHSSEYTQYSFFNVDEDKVKFEILTEDNYASFLKSIELFQPLRITILPVEASLPQSTRKEKTSFSTSFYSITKEELIEDVKNASDFSVNFLILLIISSIIAGIGILKNNIAILIGAMVIAPFLGPAIALSLGTTVGDSDLLKRSLKTTFLATFIAFSVSVLWGLLFDVSNISFDPVISFQDIALAMACGIAGVFSLLGNQSSSLVGVTVAAALLPPLFKSGMLMGGGFYKDSVNSLLLYFANVISLNLSGVITFYLAGIKPSKWWEKERAQKQTVISVLIWSFLLVVLAIIIFQISHT